MAARSALVHIRCRPPASSERSVLRIVAYGDSLTAGFPSFEPYAQRFVDELASQGIYVDVTVCGLCGLTAGDMLRCAGEFQPVYDPLSRAGVGLLEAARRKEGAWREADLVLIMTGTNDLGKLFDLQGPEEIGQRIIALHRICLAEGIPTVALGIPDAGGIRGKKLLKATELTQSLQRQWATWRSVANGVVARWCREPGTRTASPSARGRGSLGALRPELFLSTGSMLPFGPQTRKLGAWESDNLHFTAVGSRLLGERLACRLSQLLIRLRSGRVLLCDETSRNMSIPSVATFLEALDMEECTAKEESFEVKDYPHWEREAAFRIQQFLLVQKGLRKRNSPSIFNACCTRGRGQHVL